MLRWGILGAGGVAGGWLAPAMRAAGHDLAVVGSRSLTRAQAFAANHGVRRARGSYEEVLEATDVEAVYVSLPNAVHERWTVAALEAGKHVLCEKPLSVDAASGGRMAAASAASRRLLMEALIARFHPRTQALVEVVRSGEIGEVRLIHAAASMRMRAADSHRARVEQGGGALLDLGVYGVAATRWVAGSEPDGVRAVQRRWPTGVDGTTTALLAFADGTSASVHASYDAAPHEIVEVVGTDGVVRVPQAFTAAGGDKTVLMHDDDVIGTWQADPVQLMLTAFADAVAHGKQAPLPVDDSLATVEVLDRIRAAAI
jgi:D-xylose 1-dehydrogenase (NADP+, D-xylono-1,5-lactone-forming)